MLSHVLLALALGSAAGQAAPTSPSAPAPAPEPAAPHPSGEIHVTGIPLVSYGSDIGVQAGGAAYVYRLDAAGERSDWAALGLSYTTRGPRSVELKGELLRVAGTPLRTFVQAKGSLDTSAPYWGEGAGLGGLGVSPGAGSPPEPYRYKATSPWLSAILRGPLLGGLGWWTRVRYTHVSVDEPPALLLREAPPGFRGASSTLFHAGLVHDTRDRVASPRSGVLADLSGFASPSAAPLSDHRFYGFDAGVRAYAELAPGVVLAGRALYDLKRGDVPFFERTQYEGITYGEGLGGSGTIRGLARDRLSGEEKLLAGFELRAFLAASHLFGALQEWGLSAGADAGRARDPGRAAVAGAGVFGGGRLMLNRAVVLRVEAGYAGQGAPAYYISFDEAF